MDFEEHGFGIEQFFWDVVLSFWSGIFNAKDGDFSSD